MLTPASMGRGLGAMGLGEGDMIYFRFNELPAENSSVSIPSQTPLGYYSDICSPDPPISAGKSLNFGSPSRMGSTVSA